MFCPECGTRIDDESALFCEECGTRVRDEEPAAPVVEPQESEPVADGKSDFVSADDAVHGLILTNLSLLAAKLRVPASSLEKVLQQYIDGKRRWGIAWELIDAGNYTFKKRNLLGMGRTVHLKATDKPWPYMEILMDVHQHELKRGLPESQYLFILGGDDIVPMPCVRHYFPEADSDKTIDTDLLYAYPYGEEMLAELENQQIFRYEQLFMVGRLPIGEDTTADDLVNYLQRSLNHTGGIPVTGAYGQCDPHWKNVSARVATDLIGCGLLPNLDGQIGDEYYYHRMILSPMVIDRTVDQVLNKEASLFYFNLHGSDALQASGYFGEVPVHQGAYQVICPAHLATLELPNIVVTEACYGARFIGMDKAHSMLLSAMSNETLAFLGSSRVAWGSVDPEQGATPQNVGVGLADVLAYTFMNALLQGYTVGQALFAARCAVFKARPGDLKTALTLVEFNLFGDPTLSFDVSGGKKIDAESLKKSNLMGTEEQLSCKVETMKSAGKAENSILSMVRSAVDANIMQIHQSIADHLYAHYGIEPRPADAVLAMHYADGREEMQFHYDSSPADRQVNSKYMVTTTKQGDIIDIYASR